MDDPSDPAESRDPSEPSEDPPELLPPELTAPVLTQRDLNRQWCAILGRLGFAGASLWTMALDPGGHMTGQVVEFSGMPDQVDPQTVDNLMSIYARVLGEVGPDASVALLRSRPGGPSLTDADRRWARALLSSAARHGVLTWPVHLACDRSVCVIPPDELIGRSIA